jgi:hypothetical protein
LFGLWLIAKIGYVDILAPDRARDKSWRAIAQQILARVPDGQTIHILQFLPRNLEFYLRAPLALETSPSHLAREQSHSFWLVNDQDRKNHPLLRRTAHHVLYCGPEERRLWLVEVGHLPQSPMARRNATGALTPNHGSTSSDRFDVAPTGGVE